jgi:hypothetical protein
VAHTCNPGYSEAEIRRIPVQIQPGQIVFETLFQNNPLQKRAGGVTQEVGPEFKPQYHKKKKKKSGAQEECHSRLAQAKS